MKKYDKEVIQLQLEHEKEVVEELKKMYEEAERQIDEKIQMLMADELTQSKIYQIEYQKALKGQIGTILDNMNSNNYDSIQDYLKNSYEDGYIGTMYSLQQQGIPLVMPIDQEQVVKAIQLDSKLSGTLYEAMGVNTNELKKSIRNEVSRGISNAYSYQDIARNINNSMGIGLNKSIRIARTEGHRVNQQSTYDAMEKAKKKGANVVKQWDATLDAKTRTSHQRVDGEIRELDETFSNGLRFPGDPQGSAAEVINCRCVLLQRARWALDDDELNTLQERAAYYGLDKTDSFDDFKRKYLENANKVSYNDVENLNRSMTRRDANIGAFSNLQVPMQKRAVLKTCRKYDVNTNGLTFKIQRSEHLLSMPIYGMTDYDNIGRIDLLPNAFIDEEELIRTIVHEKHHVEQLKKYGKKYVQEHLEEMEKEAYSVEKEFYNKYVKKR